MTPVIEGSPHPERPDPALRIRPVPWSDNLPAHVKQWFFLDYGGGEYETHDWRWVIEQRTIPAGVWWGVVPYSPTHERSLDIIAKEIELAKQAIKQLQVPVIT